MAVMVMALVVGCSAAPAPVGTSATAAPAVAAAPAAPAASAPAAAAAKFSPAVQKLIDAGKVEGTLSLIVHDSMLNSRKGTAAFVKAFNDYYGLNVTIKVDTGPGASGSPQTSQVIQEVQAGRAPSTDLYMGPDNQLASLNGASAAMAVDWRALDPRIPELAVAGGSLAFGTSFTGLTYATSFVKAADVPKTMQEVLDPKWRGKVASTPFLSGFSSLSRSTEWGPQKTLDYVTLLQKQIGGLIQANAWDRFSSGEFHILAMNSGHFEVFQGKRDGKPVEFAFASDALRLSYRGWVVPKGSAHPNLATLFALYSLTPDGQKLMYENDFLDLHLFSDSKNRALIKPFLDRGDKVYGEDGLVNAQKYVDEQKANGIVAKMTEVITKK